jgi:hypothetical protein
MGAKSMASIKIRASETCVSALVATVTDRRRPI